MKLQNLLNFSAQERNQLLSLDLTYQNLSTQPPEILEKLFAAIPQCSKLTTIELGNNCLFTLAPEHLTALFTTIAECKNLRYLSLKSIGLQHIQPEQLNALFTIISQCSNLTSLDLSENDLGCLNPKLLNTLFEVIAQSAKLVNLNLDNNIANLSPEQTSTFIAAISKCQALKVLNFNSNNLGLWQEKQQLEFFEAIAQFTELRTLELKRNDLNKLMNTNLNAFFVAISDCLKLRSINLRYNNLGEWTVDRLEIFQKIGQCQQLENFNLSYNNLFKLDFESKNLFFAAIASCPNLKILDLSNNEFGRVQDLNITYFSAIAQFKKIISLNLSSNYFGIMQDMDWNVLFTSIGHCSTLEILDLSSNNLGESGNQLEVLFYSIARCTKLMHLDLSKNYLYRMRVRPFNVLLSALADCQNLTHLNLSGNILGYTDPKMVIALFATISKCPKLTNFNFQLNNLDRARLRLEILFPTFNPSSKLSSLDLSNNDLERMPTESFHVLLTIISKYAHLRSLDVSGLNYLSDENYQVLLDAINLHPRLTCINLSNSVLYPILKKPLKKIETLIIDCHKVNQMTVEQLYKLIKALPVVSRLKIIDLTNHEVSSPNIDYLKNETQNLIAAKTAEVFWKLEQDDIKLKLNRKNKISLPKEILCYIATFLPNEQEILREFVKYIEVNTNLTERLMPAFKSCFFSSIHYSAVLKHLQDFLFYLQSTEKDNIRFHEISSEILSNLELKTCLNKEEQQLKEFLEEHTIQKSTNVQQL